MSRLQNIYERIGHLHAAMAELQRGEMHFAARATLASLTSELEDLTTLADEISAQEIIDVCDYKIVPADVSRYPIKLVSESIGKFQEMVTSFFAPKREGVIRERARFSAQAQMASSLNFGFSYSGSLGIVMYALGDQILPDDTDFDLAIQGIRRLSEANTSDEVRQVADEFGKPAIGRFYNWSKVHAETGTAIAFVWKRGPEERNSVSLQEGDFSRVLKLIEGTAEPQVSYESFIATLVALNVESKTFKLALVETDSIHGHLAEEFDWRTPHDVPGTYGASLRKITVPTLWEDDDSVSWELLALTAAKPGDI